MLDRLDPGVSAAAVGLVQDGDARSKRARPSHIQARRESIEERRRKEEGGEGERSRERRERREKWARSWGWRATYRVQIVIVHVQQVVKVVGLWRRRASS